jgi:hypothetical protein
MSRSRKRSGRLRFTEAISEVSPAWWGFAGAVCLLTPVVAYLVLHRGPEPAHVVVDADRDTATVTRHLDERAELHSLMEKFLLAATPEEKAPLVRGGAALLPAMKAWYARHPDEPGGKYTPGTATASEWIGGREFTLFGGRNRLDIPVETIAERSPEGIRLDWRCLTGAGDMEWEDWLRDRPQQSVTMRGFARTDEYYAGPFADKAKYLCVKVTDPDSAFTVWAYAERNGADGRHLSEQLPVPENSIRVTGAFAFPPDSSGSIPQVLATHIGTMGWLDESLSQSPDIKEKPPAR